MALVLNITDGTNTVNLAGTDAYCLNFGLDTPMGSEEMATDQHEIEFFGGSSTVSTNKSKLRKLFEQARRWQKTRSGPRVFVQAQVDGANTYRSEVVDGGFSNTPDFVNYERALGAQKGTITIMRRNWWEGAQVTATRTMLNSSSFLIYNNGDYTGTAPNTKKVNYFDIDATAIAGDLPAPLRSQYIFASPYFDYGSPTDDWFSISCTKTAARLEYAAIESNWSESISGTAVTDTNRTNDNYQHLTTSGANQAINFSGAPTTYLNQFLGDSGYIRIFATLAAGTSGTYKITPFLQCGHAVYGASQYISLSSTAFKQFDLGVIRYPSEYSTNKLMDSVIFGFVFGTSGIQVMADCAQMVRTDWFRKYIPPSIGFYRGEIQEDQIDGDGAYFYNGTYREDTLTRVGTKMLTLTPGFWHRFYLHIQANAVTSPKSMNLTPIYYYRPRYLGLPG